MSDREAHLPKDFRTWWWAERQLWWRDFDELGHVTAARYADLYQEACGDFVVDAWGTSDADYVVARLEIVYTSEIRRDDSPVRVYVRATRVGRSSFSLTQVLCSASGIVCSSAVGTYVAWDRRRRSARSMTVAQRAALSA